MGMKKRKWQGGVGPDPNAEPNKKKNRRMPKMEKNLAVNKQKPPVIVRATAEGGEGGKQPMQMGEGKKHKKNKHKRNNNNAGAGYIPLSG
jgi:hypothetical protein